jgi:hypothetical protein
LDDIGKVISDGTVKYEGMGTIKKDLHQIRYIEGME